MHIGTQRLLRRGWDEVRQVLSNLIPAKASFKIRLNGKFFGAKVRVKARLSTEFERTDPAPPTRRIRRFAAVVLAYLLVDLLVGLDGDFPWPFEAMGPTEDVSPGPIGPESESSAPAPGRSTTPDESRVVVLDGEFAGGEIGLSAAVERLLLGVLDELLQAEHVEIIGYADATCTTSETAVACLGLGEVRARVVRDWFVDNGVPAERISARGAGLFEPPITAGVVPLGDGPGGQFIH